MKVNNEKNDEEENSSLDPSYFVEPGYVKHMIDRFSSGLSNDHINGLATDEGGVVFKLPRLHSTRTKTHEPFQYPVLLANRSSVPVKSVVNISGKHLSGSSISSTGSIGSTGNVSSSNNHLNSKSKNQNNNCTNENGGIIRGYSRQDSTSNLPKSPEHNHNAPIHSQNNTKAANVNIKDVTNNHHHHHQYSPPPPLQHSQLNHTNNTNDFNVCLNSFDLNSNCTEKQGNSINKDNSHITYTNIMENVNPLIDSQESKLKASSGAVSAGDEQCREQAKDGHYFLSLMALKGTELLEKCQQYQAHLNQPAIPEGVLGKLRSAIGKANLLLTKKFKQFADLCDTNLSSLADEQFQVTSEDLQGFWDMMLIQIDDVEASFQELHAIKLNNWTDLPSIKSTLPQSPTNKHPPSHRSETFLTAGTNSKVAVKIASTRPTKASKATKGRSSGLHATMLAGRRQRKTSQSDELVIFVTDKAH